MRHTWSGQAGIVMPHHRSHNVVSEYLRDAVLHVIGDLAASG